MPRTYTSVEVEIDLDDIDEEDMIYALERKGYLVQGGRNHNALIDDVFSLYQEWIANNEGRSNNFDKDIRKFFETYLNKVSA